MDTDKSNSPRTDERTGEFWIRETITFVLLIGGLALCVALPLWAIEDTRYLSDDILKPLGRGLSYIGFLIGFPAVVASIILAHTGYRRGRSGRVFWLVALLSSCLATTPALVVRHNWQVKIARYNATMVRPVAMYARSHWVDFPTRSIKTVIPYNYDDPNASIDISPRGDGRYINISVRRIGPRQFRAVNPVVMIEHQTERPPAEAIEALELLHHVGVRDPKLRYEGESGSQALDEEPSGPKQKVFRFRSPLAGGVYSVSSKTGTIYLYVPQGTIMRMPR